MRPNDMQPVHLHFALGRGGSPGGALGPGGSPGGALGSGGSPGGGRMRASDAERERAAEALRRHHADGRLTTDELEERIERAYAATTLADLDELFADLPRTRSRPAGDVARGGPRMWPIVFVAPIVAMLVAVSIFTAAHVLWIIWPLTFFLVTRLMYGGRRWRSRGWIDAPRRF
jgi:hypothetical protein